MYFNLSCYDINMCSGILDSERAASHQQMSEGPSCLSWIWTDVWLQSYVADVKTETWTSNCKGDGHRGASAVMASAQPYYSMAVKYVCYVDRYDKLIQFRFRTREV